jgi:hypothetical protein
VNGRSSAQLKKFTRKMKPATKLNDGGLRLKSVGSANLHGFHAGFSFGLGLKGSVVHDRGCGRGRLLVDNRTFLGTGITHNVNTQLPSAQKQT